MQRECAEAARRELEDMLRQSQKMDTVGHLASGIAHDFNNMLAVISSSLNIIRRVIAKRDRPVEPFLDTAQDGVFRAAALTNRLLSFARKGATEIVEVDVNGHIQGLSDLLGRALNGKVKLKVQLGLVTMPAHCDPSGLENALLNLAVNARDAMPDGGRVTISTAERLLDADAAGPIGVDPGEYVEVSVSDEGTGIPPEMLAKIFEPFFSTKGAKGHRPWPRPDRHLRPWRRRWDLRGFRGRCRDDLPSAPPLHGQG
ncbi:sensor histidine kinase [Sphingobium yanoikuyae]|jgi:signal transduction histidine kinase|uniref:sensor histidine kinase n=1 Tax=Sphingobium yanoikuyae TaxID=13690 RepID=UPI00241E1604|nr:ATP-binding protein [Sphingobium yanoikuyae]